MSHSQEPEVKKDAEISEEVMRLPPLEEKQEGVHEALEESAASKAAPSPFIEAFLKELELLENAEARLDRTVSLMEQVLSQSKNPSFRDFWQARDIALKLFKEHISPQVRTALWTKYSDLSKEARRLKDLLDEQSTFAAEQIDIAIKALEVDLDQLSAIRDLPITEDPYSLSAQSLAKNAKLYIKLQRELDLLNRHASRINALRKELIRTEMRVRKKNQFFQRLSTAGDKVFPQRKNLIQQVSEQFVADVEAFIAAHFVQSKPNAPSFFLRDEIKALQNIAKVLTLNSPAFAQTRMRLSECWDKVKELDKERKKERAQQKTVFKQHAEELLAKLQQLAQEVEAGTLGQEAALDSLQGFLKQMREVPLGKDEIKSIRDRLEEIRKPLLEKIKQEKLLREEQDKERARQKQQKITDLKLEVEGFIGKAKTLDVETLIEKRDQLLERIQETALTKSEKQDLERKLKALRDVIADKKEEALMSLPEGDRQQLQQLRELLKQRQEHRLEIREQIEALRRLAGASNLDFMRAMECNNQLQEERVRLEKINVAIVEIEEKITTLEG